MNEGDWVHTAITLTGMIIIASGFIWAIKADTKLLAVRLDIVDRRLDKMETVLEAFGRLSSRIDLVDERLLSQGRRLDETIIRFNEWIGSTYEQRHEDLKKRVTHLEVRTPRE